MKFRKALVLVLLTGILFSLFACSSGSADKRGVKVVFDLQGGIYLNCEQPVVQY